METRKEKFIKILKRVGMVLSIGFNVVFLIAIIVGFSGSKKQSNNVNVACAESEVINFGYQNKKFVFYDDEEYKITFTADELNTYTWQNFYTYVDTIYQDVGVFTATLNSVNEDFETFEEQTTVYAWINTNNNNEIDLNKNSFVFMYYSDAESSYLPFTFSVDLYCSNSNYSDIKQAIELDIQANESNINDGIFATMTDSIVAFIGSLSSGITAMVGVFYDSVEGNLTAIGLLSVIVVAISLCYFLFRLIIGLIRMRG